MSSQFVFWSRESCVASSMWHMPGVLFRASKLLVEQVVVHQACAVLKLSHHDEHVGAHEAIRYLHHGLLLCIPQLLQTSRLEAVQHDVHLPLIFNWCARHGLAGSRGVLHAWRCLEFHLADIVSLSILSAAVCVRVEYVELHVCYDFWLHSVDVLYTLAYWSAAISFVSLSSLSLIQLSAMFSCMLLCLWIIMH